MEFGRASIRQIQLTTTSIAAIAKRTSPTLIQAAPRELKSTAGIRLRLNLSEVIEVLLRVNKRAKQKAAVFTVVVNGEDLPNAECKIASAMAGPLSEDIKTIK